MRNVRFSARRLLPTTSAYLPDAAGVPANERDIINPMYNLPVFAETRVDVLHAFIRAHPLGTLITNGPQGPEATHLPFFLDAPSGLLRCHMARANPQWRQLQSGDRVLVSFVGRITTSRRVGIQPSENMARSFPHGITPLFTPLESRVPLKMRLPY